jgi:hypothetical protein
MSGNQVCIFHRISNFLKNFAFEKNYGFDQDLFSGWFKTCISYLSYCTCIEIVSSSGLALKLKKCKRGGHIITIQEYYIF